MEAVHQAAFAPEVVPPDADASVRLREGRIRPRGAAAGRVLERQVVAELVGHGAGVGHRPARPPAQDGRARKARRGLARQPHVVAASALHDPNHLGLVAQPESGIGGAADGFVGGDDQIIHREQRLDGPEPPRRFGDHLPDDVHDRTIGIPGAREGNQGEVHQGHDAHVLSETAGLRDAPPHAQRGIQGSIRIHLDHDLEKRGLPF